MRLEVEQKFPLLQPAAVWEQLAQLGMTFSPAIRQVDTYFQHPARDFRQTDEAFRLRQVGDENYLTYKGPKLDTQTKTRREIELAVATGTAAASQLTEMFQALGFHLGGVVSKWRRCAHHLVAERAIELAWDDVDGLGVFLELEIVTEDSELDAARQAIAELAWQLGLELPERRSYLELLLDPARK